MIDHNNWYKYFFDGLALDLWDRVATPDRTAKEIGFIKSLIHLEENSRVLDMPCGSGRHSIALASEGYQLTSVDISDQYIDRLKKEVISKNLSMEVLKMDMLNYNTETQHEAVLCLGNSFSYFTYDKMLHFAKVLSDATRQGGFLLINTSSLAESILPNQETQNWMEVGNLYFLMSHEYNSLLGTVKTDMQFIQGDRIEKKTAYHFSYTLAEIVRMLASVGFHINKVYGDSEGNSFKLGDRQAYILLEKH